MKHITALLIENFQSHVLSDFRFGPGLNVILGQSDTGKSAAIRALRWALYNEPRGTDYVRHGASVCRVQITFSDGVEIVREVHQTARTPRHKYLVRTPGEAERIFEGFGADVPPDVSRAHGMPQVFLDKDRGVTLNLGSQLEGPFLLSDTGSNRARAIGRILGVHVVDAAIRASSRDLKAISREQGRLEKDVEEYDQQLSEFAELNQQEEALAQAESSLNRAAEAARRSESLARLRSALEEGEGALATVRTVLDSLDSLPQAEVALSRAELAAQRERELAKLSLAWGRNGEELGRVRAVIDASVAVAVAEERMSRVEGHRDRLRSLEELSRRYQTCTADLHSAQTAVTQLRSVQRAEQAAGDASARQERLTRLQEVKAGLADTDSRLEKGIHMLADLNREIEAALSEYGAGLTRLGRCPTCGGDVGPEHIKTILAELAGGGDH